MSDRLPPNSAELEQAVLGCMLSSPRTTVCDFVSATPAAEKMFFDLRHRNIFELLRDMLDAGLPVDSVTVAQRILATRKEHDFGGIAYVAALPDSVPSTANFAAYVAGLRAFYTRRRLVEVGTQIAQAGAAEADPDAALENAEQGVLAIRLEQHPAEEAGIKGAVRAALQHFESCVQHRGQLRGLATGFCDLDVILRGLKPGALITLGGRPGEGKTALAMQIVERLAIDGKVPTGVISLEMTKAELVHRLLCSRALVPSDRADAGLVSERDISALGSAAAACAAAPLQICDTGGLTITRLRSIARSMKQRFKIQLLMVDYLQLLSSGRREQNRTQELTAITGSLKAMAKELNVPVIALSQLSRAYDRERQREPRLTASPPWRGGGVCVGA
jgi:replicative DNA helicase